MDLRRLPKVDRVLAAAALSTVRNEIGPRAMTAIARAVIASWRERVKAGERAPTLDEVVRQVAERAARRGATGATCVINATGVLLHTNLGRAPLSRGSVERLRALGGGYLNLELDVELGTRSRRGAYVERALSELIGAGDVIVVNNNAAAVLLALSHWGAQREVIVSRGELVEIGGGFRVHEVLERSGARLVEVGTTNRTRVEDYVRAFGDQTGCVLRVHPSNFHIRGFCERPHLRRLVEAAHEHGVPLVKDLGGGLLRAAADALPGLDLASEPTVESCLTAGADLVCFSLDKLFGGPQGGAVAGSADAVRVLRADPLARALRVDKLTLVALEPVIGAYLSSELSAIPIHEMLGRSLDELASRVESWRRDLGALAGRTRTVDSECAVGGGTLAGTAVPSRALALVTDSPDDLARALRRCDPPVVARIRQDEVVLDARSVLPEEDEALVSAVRAALSE